MGYQWIRYEVDGDHIAWLTMNRPEKKNAMSFAMKREFETALTDADHDPDVRVVVIRGAGSCFSTGLDLVDRAQWSLDHDQLDINDSWRGWQDWTYWNSKLIIAQVHGYALAGADDLAACCDITVAAEGTKFGYPENRFVAAPPTVWPWLMGPRKSKEYLCTGNLMDAAEALQWGLVNHVVPLEELEPTVRRLALAVVAMPPAAVTANKRTVNKAFEGMAYARQGYGRDISEAYRRALKEVTEAFFTLVREQGLRAALAQRDDVYRRLGFL